MSISLSYLAQQFTRNSLRSKIILTHHGVAESLDERFRVLLAGCGHTTPKLLDLLCLPEANGLPTIDYPTMRLIQKELEKHSPWDTPPVDWSQFRVYNRVQCAVMQKIHEFVHAAWAYGFDLETCDPTPSMLQKLGLIAIKSSTALAVKYMWLYYIWAEEANEPWYHGNPACTRPVQNFLHTNFGLSNPEIHEVNEVTFGLSVELDMDPLDVNTAMFLMGM